MTENQQDPKTVIEEAGGYGTPTAEQEMPGGDEKKFAQPREEEAFDAAGLNQDSPDGETYPAGAPDLSQFGAEDQDSAGEPGAGRFGGTEEQMSSENASTTPGFDAGRHGEFRGGHAVLGGGDGRDQHGRARRRAALLLRARPGRGRPAGRIRDGSAGEQVAEGRRR